MSSDTSQQTHRRIAVLAVHGIADQPPNETVRGVANLLLASRAEGADYSLFEESPVRIGTDRVNTPNDAEPPTQPALDDLGHALMIDLLRHYRSEGPAAEYETVRLKGTRQAAPTAGPGAEPDREVHLYELYWADLSRLGQGFITILGEFYQLLFH